MDIYSICTIIDTPDQIFNHQQVKFRPFVRVLCKVRFTGDQHGHDRIP